MITVKHLKKKLDLVRDEYELILRGDGSMILDIYDSEQYHMGSIDFKPETNQENDNETINSEN